jgi:hypothetical protein
MYAATGQVLASAAAEKSRRSIVMLIMGIFLLLIAEGAIRKWLLPAYGRYLFFVRDPFLITAYLVALASGWWPKRQPILAFALGFAAFALLLGAIQLMTTGAGDSLLLIVAYGWRNYFLYIPLPFLMASTFRREDVQRFVRLVLLVSAPIAALAFLQFFSPMGSPINVGIADDISMQFRGLGLDATRTRPMGPFTSDQGQREFIVALTAIAVALWVMPARRRLAPLWLLFVGTGAAFTCIAVSGSRGAVVHVGIVLCAAVASAVVTKAGGGTVRAIVWPLVITVVAVALFPVLFPEGYETFTARWTGAGAVEAQHFKWGIFGRALYGFVDFLHLLTQTPLLGYGIGLAGNASILLGVHVDGLNAWTETDWARHIVDLGPVFGPVFIVFRVVCVIWLLRRALVATRAQGDPLPLILLAYAGVELLQAQVTGHGTVNGFTWIFCGLMLAAASADEAVERDAVPQVLQPAFPNLMR